MLSKKEMLLFSLDSIFEHSTYGKQLESIIAKLNLSKEHIINEFLHYNLELSDSIGNEVYRPIANRMVLHIHNLIPKSWHQDRQNTITELIKKISPNNTIDIGFGVPTKYIQDYILQNQNIKLTLCDVYDSAFQFAEALLDQWSVTWRNQINFKKLDLNTQEHVGDFDLYLLQDSIEHTIDPTSYLKNCVLLSPSSAAFIVSLPIGPIFPRHFYAWHTDEEAINWLGECGLKIEEQRSVTVNPEVDLFADQLAPDYHDLYALCTKNYSFCNL